MHVYLDDIHSPIGLHRKKKRNSKKKRKKTDNSGVKISFKRIRSDDGKWYEKEERAKEV